MVQVNVKGKFVVGKVDADVTVRFVEIADRMESLVQEALAGKTVRIIPQMPVNKKAHIEEAQLVADGLNETVAKLSADAANTKSKGEVKTMEKKFANRDEWAKAQQFNISGKTEHKNMDRAHRNSNVSVFQGHAITVATKRFIELGEYPIFVEGIEWKANPGRGPVGTLYVRLPEGFADVSYYERDIKERVWYDFCDFKVDGRKYNRIDEYGVRRSPFNPEDGSGELILSIWASKFTDELFVYLPQTEYDGNKYDVLRCRDIRFGMPHSDNNRNLEAALTAYVRFYAGEFLQANPGNRHGIDEHCGACKFNMYVPGYDGTDNEQDGYKNTLNTSDTIEMVQWGQEIPRRFCMVHQELVDLEAVKAINEAMAEEHDTYYDEEGNLRYVGPNEIVMGGKAINRYVALKQGTAELCASCPFYHNNAVKTDKQVSKEKAEGKEYVSKYWSEDARPERMPIQTLVHNGTHEEWITAFPGEVENPLDFRVYGIGGIVVYGSEEVAEDAREGGVLSFVPEMEEVDEVEARAARVVEIVHQTCNRFGQVKAKTLENVLALIESKPEGISARMEKRWDGAVARLAATIAEFQGE